ncbi:solute carrier organic anion transporter family member 74D-like [Centruroides vittatus]|uniref:solute carrier organic anion transporter family member 74D-like n=1 Tax=Centruroides vittatus TaxID=120091 RepID=UPI00350E937A
MTNTKKIKNSEIEFCAVPTFEPLSEDVAESENEDTLCGLGKCKPRWLQRFANSKAYLINYCLLGIVEAAYFTCFVGSLSTLEKRYAFDSRISGFLMIADNLSPIIISVLIGYFGGRAHRPRWIAAGMLIVALSCFMCALPYFIYGPALHLITKDPNELVKPKYEYCDPESNEQCKKEEVSPTIPAISIIFVANFLCGFGYTAFYAIGTPYLDDNVDKKDSPIYLASMSALRIFGPALGFLISSFSLRYYEDPFFDPGFTEDDPRWVGAWWMGFLILSALIVIFSIPMFFFPRRLPNAPIPVENEKELKNEMPKFKDLPKSLWMLAKNPIYMFILIAAILHINGVAGYFVFMPKYIETQFRKSSSKANFFTGSVPVIAVLIGIMIGGIVIKKLRPEPRYLTAYMVFIDFFGVFGFLASMFLGCPQTKMTGTAFTGDELELYNECNSGCGCTKRIFEPVCSMDGKSTYFSPCFAGCTGLNDTSGNDLFNNCSCIFNGTGDTFTTDVIGGYCPLDCNMFLPYMIVLSLSKFMASTSRVGNSLILLRCVNPQDKSMALGTIGAALSAFAFIPYPLIFGAITDSACIVWEENCGKTGNCWLYDTDKFRYYLHGLGITLLLAGNFFHIGIFCLSHRLKNFYEDEKEGEKETINIKHLSNSLKNVASAT